MPALRREDAVNAVCPWSGKPISDDALTVYRGAVWSVSAIPAAGTNSTRPSPRSIA